MEPLVIDSEFQIYINFSQLFSENYINNGTSMIEKYEKVILANFKIENCHLGEIYNGFLHTCIPCSKGTYSINISDLFCQVCPKQASLCYENIIVSKPKYWKSPKTQIYYVCNPNVDSCMY